MSLGRDRFCMRKRCSSPWSLAAHPSVKPDPGKEQSRRSEQPMIRGDTAWPHAWTSHSMQPGGAVAGHCHIAGHPVKKHLHPWQGTAYLLGC